MPYCWIWFYQSDIVREIYLDEFIFSSTNIDLMVLFYFYKLDYLKIEVAF